MLQSIQMLLSPRHYFFWLLVVSALCFALERLHPWRREQSWRRPQFGQDVFFLLFNGHIFAALTALWVVQPVRSVLIDRYAFDAWFLGLPQHIQGKPILIQIAVFLLVKDFAEFVIHYLLHRVHFLWVFHRLHHSIVDMDWIGNFRFHWMESVVYGLLKWLPLALFVADGRVMLGVAAFSTLIGHLNHANLRLDWGPLRYVFNSPRMHLWHHAYENQHRYGQNFGVVFSAWEWLFRTAYFPFREEGPERLGFKGMANFPRTLWQRLLYPLGR